MYIIAAGSHDSVIRERTATAEMVTLDTFLARDARQRSISSTIPTDMSWL